MAVSFDIEKGGYACVLETIGGRTLTLTLIGVDSLMLTLTLTITLI